MYFTHLSSVATSGLKLAEGCTQWNAMDQSGSYHVDAAQGYSACLESHIVVVPTLCTR
jgi:hypothetical protein